MKITRLVPLALGLIVLGSTGCTPQEVAFWQSWHQDDPRAAENYLSDIATEAASASAPAVRVDVPESAPETAAPEAATTEPGIHCYILAGGNYCAYDGSPDAGRYAAAQAAFYAALGLADPGLQPEGTGNPPAEPEQPLPDNVRCFILVGGTYCYAEGDPEYARAEQAEREYLDHWAHQTIQQQEQQP